MSAAVVLGVPALLGPPSALLLALPAIVAVSVPMLPRPSGRTGAPVITLAVLTLSVAVDLAYRGKPGNALLWMPFEYAGLLAMLVPLIRRASARLVVPLGLAVSVTALALPLRFTVRNPASGAAGSAFAVLLALVPVACAAGIGGYLRMTDHRRRAAVLRARQEQRLRMARVLHDSVAHELTGILMEVQAARAAPYRPEQHDAMLARLEDAGVRALDEMDRTLRSLRAVEDANATEGVHATDDGAADEPPAPTTRVYGLRDLPDLLGRFAASGTVATELDGPGDLVGTLPADLDETLYAVVLESLTNIRRHAASAAKVTVTARRDAGAARIVVTDDGGDAPPHPRRDGGGTGLAGLDERLRILGGSLTAGPCGEGWRVVATLPVPRGH